MKPLSDFLGQEIRLRDRVVFVGGWDGRLAVGQVVAIYQMHGGYLRVQRDDGRELNIYQPHRVVVMS